MRGGRRPAAVHRRAGHHRPGGLAALAGGDTGSRPTRRSPTCASDETLRAEIQTAVDDANKAVSQAEAIKEFRILPRDFTEATGELTPSLKVKRNVVMKEYADEIAAIYATADDRSAERAGGIRRPSAPPPASRSPRPPRGRSCSRSSRS